MVIPVAKLETVSAQVPAARRTVWSGIYTHEQAENGAKVYADACSRCHREDLSGYAGLRGAKFIENWREDNLESLWKRVSKSMPAGAPGSLSEKEYVDVLAFILEANEFPAGKEPLTAAEIPEIRFEGRKGPEAVPDFALVRTVGCLDRGSDGNWRILRASVPVRTRNPEKSLPAELTAASTEMLGTNTFRILDGSELKNDVHAGRKASVKGFLIRKPNEDRLNTTAVEVLAQSCQ